MPLPDTFVELQSDGSVMLYLPRLRWRAHHSLHKLHSVGFRNTVLEQGIDGAVADARAVAEDRGWFFDPCLSAGEIACSLSMLGLWQRVIDEDLPYLVIFEDDVLPHPDIRRLGPAYLAETPRDADFVLMGNQMEFEEIAALPDPHRRVLNLPAWCLHAYVVTREGARRGLEMLRRELAGDRWLSPVDMELRTWMERGEVRYACWNGTMLPRVYLSSDELQDDSSIPPDVARQKCSTGLFFQNFALGSSIWPEREPPVRRVPLLRKRRRKPRPRALFISPMTPRRDGNGLAIRAGVALEALARRYEVQLAVVPAYGKVHDAAWALGFVNNLMVLPESLADPFLKLVPRISTRSEQHRARVLYREPLQAKFCTPQAAAEIVDFAGREIALVYVLRLFLAGLAEPWLANRASGARFILDIDEDEIDTACQRARLQRRDGDEDAAAVEEADARKYQRIAREWVPRADLVLVSGDHETASVEQYAPRVPPTVLPNPVPPIGKEGAAPEVDLLFVGNCGYLPNVDAARWLCQDLMPRVCERMERAIRVAVVGSDVDERVASLSLEGLVEVVADPYSVTPWYRATTIAVAPLRAGGGTRLKILEAFAHRRPVVSTSLGAEGLPVRNGEHLLTADTASDFADACARLLRDAELRATLVRAAVDVAIEHARPRIVSRLVTILES